MWISSVQKLLQFYKCSMNFVKTTINNTIQNILINSYQVKFQIMIFLVTEQGFLPERGWITRLYSGPRIQKQNITFMAGPVLTYVSLLLLQGTEMNTHIQEEEPGAHDSILCWLKQKIGEGNGTPLQYSCLENPRDRGAWWAAVYGVAQSRTRLK